jgi:sugar O-acyltransferase (sialic acid O-acetyltransferase NeuD family)
MTQPLVVIGSGGMGRCVLDVVDAVNVAAGEADGFEVLGVLDDAGSSRELLEARGVRILGGVASVEELPKDVGYVIGIGDGGVRGRIAELAGRDARPSPVLVHPNVHLGHGVSVDAGSVLCSHVSVENNVRIGRHVHVNQNSTVGHDAVLGDFVTVSPLVAVSGAVTLDEGAFLGTGSSVNQGLAVGARAVVGSGAAVVHAVAAETTVVGVPARLLT